MRKLLINLDACSDTMKWAEGKNWKEIFETCPKGEWLLWLYYNIDGDFKTLTLAKAKCANTVRHLMKDKRSTYAIDACFAFCEGKISRGELADAADAAAYAVYDADAYAAAAYAAAYAAYAAYASAAASAASAASAAASADSAAAAKNELLTANIVRETIPIEKWNLDINLNWD